MKRSQLSSTTRRRPRNASMSGSATGRPGSSRTWMAVATDSATRSGSARGARSTSHTPSPDPSQQLGGNLGSARRVFARAARSGERDRARDPLPGCAPDSTRGRCRQSWSAQPAGCSRALGCRASAVEGTARRGLRRPIWMNTSGRRQVLETGANRDRAPMYQGQRVTDEPWSRTRPGPDPRSDGGDPRLAAAPRSRPCRWTPRSPHQCGCPYGRASCSSCGPVVVAQIALHLEALR